MLNTTDRGTAGPQSGSTLIAALIGLAIFGITVSAVMHGLGNTTVAINSARDAGDLFDLRNWLLGTFDCTRTIATSMDICKTGGEVPIYTAACGVTDGSTDAKVAPGGFRLKAACQRLDTEGNYSVTFQYSAADPASPATLLPPRGQRGKPGATASWQPLMAGPILCHVPDAKPRTFQFVNGWHARGVAQQAKAKGLIPYSVVGDAGAYRGDLEPTLRKLCEIAFINEPAGKCKDSVKFSPWPGTWRYHSCGDNECAVWNEASNNFVIRNACDMECQGYTKALGLWRIWMDTPMLCQCGDKPDIHPDSCLAPK